MASSIISRGEAFQVKWRAGRKGTWQSCTFNDVKHAERAKELAEAHRHKISDAEVYQIVLDLPAESDADSPTFAVWALDWVSRKKGVQPDVLKGYERQLKTRAIPKLGKFRLHEIEHDRHVADWLNWLEKDLRLAPATVRRYHSVVHQCMKAAVGKHISINPLDPPTGEKNGQLPKLDPYDACFLTPDEAQLILDRCSDHIRDMVEVAFNSGMRLGELIALRVRDVDLKRKVIHVRRALKQDGTVGPPKSKKSRRSIKVTKAIVLILERVLSGKRPDDLVFPAPRGGMWSKDNLRERFWKPAVRAAQRCAEHPPALRADKRGREREDPTAVSTCACLGRLHTEPRFHDTRHTHISWLIAAGWDPYKIQLRAGHESIKTTYDIYGHLFSYGDDDGLDKFEEIASSGRKDLALAA
jgi:integrase